MNSYNKYYSTDILAHYTKLESAIEILKSKRLRFGLRAKAYDCLERLFGFDAYRIKSQMQENYEYSSSLEVHQVLESISGFYSGIKQVCFCKTTRTDQFKKSIDNLSFLHMRMWEQYGDCYKGVCFLFSQEKLLKANPNCISGDMDYKLLSELSSVRPDKGTDIDQLKEIGKNSYIPIREQEILNLAFEKSSDYIEENEFRIMKTRCNKDVDDYLDISNSIIAVAYFPGYSRERKYEEICKEKPCYFKECEYKSFVFKQLEFINRCRENGIDILRISAESGIIRFETEEEFSQYCESIKKMIDKINP